VKRNEPSTIVLTSTSRTIKKEMRVGKTKRIEEKRKVEESRRVKEKEEKTEETTLGESEKNW
jgi:hypothetical protein